ncbi:unnamed protein product [Candidula unifasciata]|uniref:Solute carrier family 25 member 32 n=1 Tax=Candidula unifasciata TaxID=100452 RepID=A0A8S3ZZD6_9EUPU|nr:unnamed protein product [Candidula unifasciata]
MLPMESRKQPVAEKTSRSFVTHVRFEHLAAGVTGGVVSSLALHPLDLIKVRFQVDEGPGKKVIARPHYNGVIHAFRAIVQTDGWKGLYRGVTPNVTGAGLSWGFYFFFYNTTKTWMQGGDTTKNLGPGRHMMIASLAGLATLTLTNPIWVSKTRMCLHYGNPGNVQFVGMWETLIGVYRKEGIRGLYRGFLPGIFGISHGALQFMAYEELKTLYSRHRNQPLDTRLSSLEYLTFAALSKMFAATITYPYQVLRSRLQDQHRSYNGVLDVLKQIWVQESCRGLFKGLGVYLIHILPNTMIVFGVYEMVVHVNSQSHLEEDLAVAEES